MLDPDYLVLLLFLLGVIAGFHWRRTGKPFWKWLWLGLMWWKSRSGSGGTGRVGSVGFDLDKIELVARRARDSFGHEEPSWYNGGWSEDSVSPDAVLELVDVARAATALIDDYHSETPDGGATTYALCKAIDRLRGDND